MKIYYYHLSFIKTYVLWPLYKAKRETLAIVATLKQPQACHQQHEFTKSSNQNFVVFLDKV